MLPSGPDKKLASPNYYYTVNSVLKNPHFLAENTKYSTMKIQNFFTYVVEWFFKVAEVENCYKFPTNPDKCPHLSKIHYSPREMLRWLTFVSKKGDITLQQNTVDFTGQCLHVFDLIVCSFFIKKAGQELSTFHPAAVIFFFHLTSFWILF